MLIIISRVLLLTVLHFTNPLSVVIWTNSNSAGTFLWTVDDIPLTTFVAAPMNMNEDCTVFGGFPFLNVTISSVNARVHGHVEYWMRLRNNPQNPQFPKDDSLTDQMKSAAEKFAKCAGINKVSGVLCVHEDDDISKSGLVNCDMLKEVANHANLKYGVLGAPGVMATDGVAVAGGELYECSTTDPNYCYFVPPACPDGAADYGQNMGRWIKQNKKITSATSTPFLGGGTSAGCGLQNRTALAVAVENLLSEEPATSQIGLWG